MSEPLVVLSQRIGPLTRWETTIAERVPCRVECLPLGTKEEIFENGRGARAIILGAVEPFDAAAFEALPELGLIARRGVGVDNVDVAAAAARGITVTCVPDATVEEVSDHALTLVLALLRGVPAASRAIEAQRLELARAAVDRSRPLRECVLAVIGAGRIGRRLVAKAAPLMREVLVVDPFVEAVEGARIATVEEALASADAISVHTPLTEGTRGLIGDFGSAREGLVVVNTARAGVVDEAALEAAVRSGVVGGVGLDVSADEGRWRQLIIEGYTNVVLTGHTGGRGALAQETLRRTCADQVVDFLSGRRPAHVVT